MRQGPCQRKGRANLAYPPDIETTTSVSGLTLDPPLWLGSVSRLGRETGLSAGALMGCWRVALQGPCQGCRTWPGALGRPGTRDCKNHAKLPGMEWNQLAGTRGHWCWNGTRRLPGSRTGATGREAWGKARPLG